MPFYRHKGTIYNIWFIGLSTISMGKASPRRLVGYLPLKAHMSIGAQRHAHSAMAAMWLHGDGSVRVSASVLMRALDHDPEASGCPSNWLHLYCLTRLHAANRVIAYSLICNQNLVCGEGTRLDCCNVISATGELGMTIITLGRLYFMLSCRFAPTDVVLVLHGRRTAVRPHVI
jgi:hypothetical protein